MSRVLVIGDLHLPFEKDGYFEHCKAVAKKHKTDTTVFIGDIADNHFASFHLTDPSAMGGEQELDLAIDKLKRWYKQWPDATVILGNHDRIVTRKQKMANLPSKWVRDYNDVLGTPNWNWHVEYQHDGVLYVHGEGSTARTTVKNYGQSVVQGHRHSEFYCEYYAGPANINFAMQVGCGVDRESYAMEYARAFKHQMLGCGVVIDGKEAYLEPMRLGKHKI